MKEVATGVQAIEAFPPFAINAYLVGDVLVDAATRHHGRTILRQLRGHAVAAHTLTHGHGDHQGASHAVCSALAIPLWAHDREADAVERGDSQQGMPTHPVNWLFGRLMPGPGHPVARRLQEGDEIAGFTVLYTPGHSPGHISLWREGDRTLICGDVFTNIDTLTGLPGLHEPKPFFTPDPALNRRSMRRLAELRPRVTLFGHGRPLTDPGKLKELVERVAPST